MCRESPVKHGDVLRLGMKGPATGGVQRPSSRLPDRLEALHGFGRTLAVKDWAAILPSRMTNVSVAISYTLAPVSAVQRR